MTWLDREMLEKEPIHPGRGFGAEVRKSLALRQQWLIEQGLTEREGDMVRYRDDMLVVLQQRELRRAAGQLSDELGLSFTETRTGQAVEGICRRSVMVGDAKYAVIERSRDFTLVPWRPVLEQAVGKSVSGITRASGISWTIGRGRSGPSIDI